MRGKGVIRKRKHGLVVVPDGLLIRIISFTQYILLSLGLFSLLHVNTLSL